MKGIAGLLGDAVKTIDAVADVTANTARVITKPVAEIAEEVSEEFQETVDSINIK